MRGADGRHLGRHPAGGSDEVGQRGLVASQHARPLQAAPAAGARHMLRGGHLHGAAPRCRLAPPASPPHPRRCRLPRSMPLQGCAPAHSAHRARSLLHPHPAPAFQLIPRRSQSRQRGGAGAGGGQEGGRQPTTPKSARNTSPFTSTSTLAACAKMRGSEGRCCTRLHSEGQCCACLHNALSKADRVCAA